MSGLTASEVAISLPFRFDASGRVGTTTDSSKIWMDRVASLIGTNVGERLMRPFYGTKISQVSFSNMSSVEELVQRTLEDAFNMFFPKLQLIDSNVDFNEIEGTVYITVIFLTPNKEQVSSNIGIAGISSNKLLSEEKL